MICSLNMNVSNVLNKWKRINNSAVILYMYTG